MSVKSKYPGAIFVVPAREGSKRLPGKNKMQIGGRTLLQIAFEQGIRAVGRGVLTTDIAGYGYYHHVYGEDVLVRNRPRDLCTDETLMLPVLRDAVGYWSATKGSRPDVVILLQPTSPLRQDADIHGTIQEFLSYWPNVAYKGGREDGPWSPDGSVYVYDARWLMETPTIALSDPLVTSRRVVVANSYSVDIDTREDFDLAVKITETIGDPVNGNPS